MHIDISWKFREMIEFRDRRVELINLMVYRNEKVLRKELSLRQWCGVHRYYKDAGSEGCAYKISVYCIWWWQADEENQEQEIFSFRSENQDGTQNQRQRCGSFIIPANKEKV